MVKIAREGFAEAVGVCCNRPVSHRVTGSGGWIPMYKNRFAAGTYRGGCHGGHHGHADRESGPHVLFLCHLEIVCFHSFSNF